MDLETAFVVSSCDAYRDLWEPYFKLFFRYWPDCPFPIYLISNFHKYNDPRVNAVQVGDDKGWATAMRKALLKLGCPYFILTMEDFFLNRPVSSERVIRLLNYMKERKAGYLRLFPCPGPDEACSDNDEVGEIKKGSAYRTSLQLAIWERGTMLKLLKDGEDPWQMEINGSVRSSIMDSLFLSAVRCPSTDKIVDPPISYICTAVEKGRWNPEALEFCAKVGIRLDLKHRLIRGSLLDNLAVMQSRIFWSLINPARRLKIFYQNAGGRK